MRSSCGLLGKHAQRADRRVIRRRRVSHVHHHRNRSEIADQTQHVDHALLAESIDRAAVSRVADAAGPEQLVAEVIRGLLVIGHAVRAMPLGNRVRDAAIEAGFQRQRVMDAPFELLRPLARDDQHHEFAQPGLQRALVAQVFAHFLKAVHQLGAAQQRNERSAHAAARPGSELCGSLFLRWRHALGRQRRHAVLDHAFLRLSSSANALVARSRQPASGAPERPPRASISRLAKTGPRICPVANAAVMAAISPAPCAPPTCRASCMPTLVTTMKLPPTQSAATRTPPIPGIANGAPTPRAITSWLTAHKRRYGECRERTATASVDATAAAPKTGQAQPNTAGSAISSRAIAGIKVAGMM